MTDQLKESRDNGRQQLIRRCQLPVQGHREAARTNGKLAADGSAKHPERHLQILDALGRIVMVLGVQTDGSTGLAAFDPTSGQKLMQAGQSPGGGSSYGLSVWNAVTTQFQRVAGASTVSAPAAQTTNSTTPVTFGDDPHVTAIIGSSGQAEVTFGATIGTGGDNDEGLMHLTVDGSATGERVSVSCGGAGIGVQATGARTTIISGLTPGAHSFSLNYLSLTGVHGCTFTDRYVTVAPL